MCFIITCVRYVLNYSPFDITYKLCKFLPFKVVICCMKEIQRASKVLHGVHFAMKIYPNEWVIICVVGVLKGLLFCRFVKKNVKKIRLEVVCEKVENVAFMRGCILFC